MKRSIVVKQDEEQPVAKEVLAASIIHIGNATSKLLASGINMKAIVVLLHDHLNAKVTKTDIRAVLNALPELEHAYCGCGKGK